ncbi:MAG TPA: hypothetical protein VKE42_01815 [Candidatus Cybelea sp.]|nr:hypothetical protein [Candidatus Cybelea sp.]
MNERKREIIYARAMKTMRDELQEATDDLQRAIKIESGSLRALLARVRATQIEWHDALKTLLDQLFQLVAIEHAATAQAILQDYFRKLEADVQQLQKALGAVDGLTNAQR